MFISPAFAAETAATASGTSMVVQLILIMVVFYIFLIRPQQKKMKQHEQLLQSIKKGDKIGYVTVESKDDNHGFLTENGAKSVQVDLIASEDVEKANWFVLSMRAVGDFFGNVWDSVSSMVKGWF